MFRPPSLLSPQIVPTAALPPQGSRGFYVRAYRALLPPHAPDMLTVRIQAIDGTGTFTLSDFSALSAAHFAPPALLRFSAPTDPVRLPPWPPTCRDVEAATLARDGPPPITRTTFPTCRAHYPGGSSGCPCRFLPRSRGLPPKGVHNAGCLTFEVMITYPFHPLVGQSVLVVGDKKHGGTRYLIRFFEVLLIHFCIFEQGD